MGLASCPLQVSSLALSTQRWYDSSTIARWFRFTSPHPLQVKALAASSAVCAGLGVVAVGGWKLAGLQAR